MPGLFEIEILPPDDAVPMTVLREVADAHASELWGPEVAGGRGWARSRRTISLVPLEPTNATSPTKYSAAYGETNTPANNTNPPPIDKDVLDTSLFADPRSR